MSQKGWQKIKIKPYIVSIRINFGSIRAIVATPVKVFYDLQFVFRLLYSTFRALINITQSKGKAFWRFEKSFL